MSSPSPSGSSGGRRQRPPHGGGGSGGGSGGRRPRPPHHNPNRPHGGRRGGNIYTDYGIYPGSFITPIFQTGDNGCDYNYTNDVINAQFRFNQCAAIADDRGASLIENDELRQVCRATLNDDLINAQQNYGVCRNNSYTNWGLFPTATFF